jgi:serine/threonine protein kinase
MKELSYHGMNPADVEKYVFGEIKVTSNVVHKHIVKLNAYFDYKPLKKVFIVMEFCNGGDLGMLFDQYLGVHWKKRIPEEQMMRWMHQICFALNYLHTLYTQTFYEKGQGIAHRDVKPENIFLMFV